MQSDHHLILWLVTCSLTCLGHSLFFVKKLWKRGLCKTSCWRIRLCAKRKQRTELEDLVDSEVNERLCRRVHVYAEVFGLSYIGYNACLVLALAGGGPEWLTEMQRHLATLFSFTLLAMRLCPLRTLERWLPWCYVWIMILGSGIILFADTSNIFGTLRELTISMFVFTITSLTFGQVRPAIVCNVAMIIPSMYIVNGMEIEPADKFDFMTTLTCITALTIALTSHETSALHREISHSVKSLSLSTESSAMTTLLGLVCDVVIELDASLRVAEHAPRLSAMLNMNRDTQGMDLTQIMPQDSDKERFQERLSVSMETSTESGVPGAFHVTLRDSMGNNIPVEIFYVLFHNPARSRSCFVGIREMADQPIAKLPRSRINKKQEVSSADGGSDLQNPPSHGTAPVAEARTLGDSLARGGLGTAPDDASSVCSGSSAETPSSRWTLLHNDFQITTDRGKYVSLIQLLSQLNIKIPKKTCCAYHAAVRDVTTQIKALARLPCYEQFRIVGNCQCTSCGVVLDSKDTDLAEHCKGSPIRRVLGASDSTSIATPAIPDVPAMCLVGL